MICSQTCFSRPAIATYPRSVCPAYAPDTIYAHAQPIQWVVTHSSYAHPWGDTNHLVPYDQLQSNQRLLGDQPRFLVPSPLPVVLAQATEAKIHKTSDAKIHKKTHAKIHKSTKILKSTRQQKLRHIHLVIEKLSKGPPRSCHLW